MAGCNQFAGLCFDCLFCSLSRNTAFTLIRIRVPCMSAFTYSRPRPACFCIPSSMPFLRHSLFLIAISQLFSSYEFSLSGGKYIPRFLFHRTGKPVVSTVALLCTSVLFGDDQFQIPVTQKFLCRTYRTLCALLAFFGYAFYYDKMNLFYHPLQELIHFQPISYGTLGMDRIISCGIITLISLVSSVHYFHVSYLDKVRTRIFLFFPDRRRSLYLFTGYLTATAFRHPVADAGHCRIHFNRTFIYFNPQPLYRHLFHHYICSINSSTIYNLWMQFFNS